LQIIIQQLGIRRLIAPGQFISGKGQGIALHGDSSVTLAHRKPPLFEFAQCLRWMCQHKACLIEVNATEPLRLTAILKKGI
jgi:hypothetical protein